MHATRIEFVRRQTAVVPTPSRRSLSGSARVFGLMLAFTVSAASVVACTPVADRDADLDSSQLLQGSSASGGLQPQGAPQGTQQGGEEKREEALGIHAKFDTLLRRYVRDQRVDYLAWRMRDRAALGKYLARMANVPVTELSKNEQLAFYINLYNASMIRQVLDRVTATWTPAADGYGVFKDKSIRLGTERVSLDHLEHEIIRKRFDEPRVHAALVCGAKSCPPLGDTAFTGKSLEQRLAANMRKFVHDPSRNVIDHERKQLRLSKLFEWFRGDFGKDEAAIKRYVAKHLPGQPDLSAYAVAYLDYKWSLNITPESVDPVSGDRMEFVEIRRDAKLMPIAASGSTHAVRAGELLRVVGRTEGGFRVRRPGIDLDWQCPAEVGRRHR